MNLKNNVNLLGNIDNDKISMYLKKSSVYVMTSYSESFGIVLLEAMSNSIPCIAFDSASGAKELLKNGVGILVKNRDITKMSNEIINLISDDNLNAKYASNGYELCKKYLTSNVEKEWIKLLK